MENKESGSYRKTSDNISKTSNYVFNSLKSISTTTNEETITNSNSNEKLEDTSSNSSNTSTGSNSVVSAKPKTFVDGALKGVLSFGVSVVNGATGVIREPIKGAQNGGFTGFAKGVAKGVSGVVILPVVGAMEMVSLTTQGFINTPLTIIDAMRSSPKEEEMVTVMAEVPRLFFAIDLEESLASCREKGIPHLLKICIEYIEKRKDVEGIFRISGSKLLIDEIQGKFDDGQIKSLDDLDSQWIYEVACIFKSYFRYLPNSIIPTEQITELYRIQNSITNPTDKANALKDVVNSLPEPNYTILYQCLSLLNDIAQTKSSLMNSSNLSIIFGPSWLRPNVSDLQEIASANTIVYNLLQFYFQIFIKTPDLSILNIQQSPIQIKPLIQK